LVERFHLRRSKYDKSWFVQLATRTKKKINEIVKGYPLDTSGINIVANLNILSLGSYDFLIRMD
jgi:hypothetical protein